MSFVIKEGASTDGLPAIVLGEETLYVPRLKLRHRIAVATHMSKVIAAVNKFKESDGQEFNPADITAMLDMFREALLGLYPKLTVDDLLDLDTDFAELTAAIPVIARQATSRRAAAGDAGEPEAASATTRETGPGSSPTSA